MPFKKAEQTEGAKVCSSCGRKLNWQGVCMNDKCPMYLEKQ